MKREICVGMMVMGGMLMSVGGVHAMQPGFENEAPIWEGYEYVSGMSASLDNVEFTCDGNNTVATLTLNAQNAGQYLVSYSASLDRASWQAFTSPSVTFDWDLSAEFGDTTVYYMFKSVNENATALQHIDIHFTDEGQCDVFEEILPMRKSLYNGEFEFVSRVDEGDLIVGEHYDTVYLIDKKTRRPFFNEAIYYSWYNFQDDVKVVSDATLTTVPLGAPMLPKPGGKLVKLVSEPTVYFIQDNGADGKLLPFKNEEHAQKVLGVNWKNMVIDIDVTLFERFER